MKNALFRAGRYPVVARLAFSGGMPFVADDDSTVRSLALQFMPPGQEEWRTGMMNIPVFPFKTAQAFYDQMVATTPDPKTGKVDPPKMHVLWRTSRGWRRLKNYRHTHSVIGLR
ncbi:hypothetical protein P0D69_21905 [Paraburkholderia sediminicola]|uniref:hypothetical protein n=1 Tax=Paraburkholderia sediminicola TaxID=458836 RepID=UPI0038B711B9